MKLYQVTVGTDQAIVAIARNPVEAIKIVVAKVGHIPARIIARPV